MGTVTVRLDITEVDLGNNRTQMAYHCFIEEQGKVSVMQRLLADIVSKNLKLVLEDAAKKIN